MPETIGQTSVVSEPEHPVDTASDAPRIIKRYAMWAAGAGVLPLPLIDMALIGGIQLKMVYELSKAYGLPFQESRAKTLIGALVGSVVPYGVASSGIVGGLASLVKAVPVVGPIVAFTFAPALASASTYAVGRVFSQHFASGGTLLTFDSERMREHFRREYDAARETFKAKGDKPVAAKPASTRP
jgi:uncharacterized protein (DUF697 family)